MSAQYSHAPNATARRRTLRHLAKSPDVPCAGCGDPISAARAALPIAHERCADCNAPSLSTSKEVRDRAPMYETDAWSRGIKL